MDKVIEKTINKEKDTEGWTALHFAAKHNQSEVVKLLVAKGADVNERNKDGEVPLHLTETRIIAGLLIQKGADVNISDFYGTTPLKIAKEQGHDEVASLLCEHGAKE